ncbi:lysozyme [Sphingobacterium chungjuense]|uniref:lysozyme n=1 Tax=Sphingobacterium chungjuense TaxID=2675553 RepID=UPI00140A8535|nr:lysozyme [Sphingobacterium chungjuense]
MKTSEIGLALIKKWEGFSSTPYLDPIGIPTIGYGFIRYPGGVRVTTQDESITIAQADELLLQLLTQNYEADVHRLITAPLNQNQFDALVSFTYNLGAGNLAKSTLRRKVNLDPSNPSIRSEFTRWNQAAGRVLEGLTNRRQAEAALYFRPYNLKNQTR